MTKKTLRYCHDCKGATEQEIVQITPSMILSPIGWACRNCKTLVEKIDETPEQMQKRANKDK